jgi:cytochrome c oxidase assembly protein subunit 15
LLVVVVAQAGVGYVQYFNNVPAGLVMVHVAGATAVYALAVGVLLGCRSVLLPAEQFTPVLAEKKRPSVSNPG